MDPVGQWVSTRAGQLSATGQFCWPPAGSFVAITGHFLMAADTPARARLISDPEIRETTPSTFDAGTEARGAGNNMPAGSGLGQAKWRRVRELVADNMDGGPFPQLPLW